jgi:hypothetical protein
MSQHPWLFVVLVQALVAFLLAFVGRTKASLTVYFVSCLVTSCIFAGTAYLVLAAAGALR